MQAHYICVGRCSDLQKMHNMLKRKNNEQGKLQASTTFHLFFLSPKYYLFLTYKPQCKD